MYLEAHIQRQDGQHTQLELQGNLLESHHIRSVMRVGDSLGVWHEALGVGGGALRRGVEVLPHTVAGQPHPLDGPCHGMLHPHPHALHRPLETCSPTRLVGFWFIHIPGAW